MVKDTVYLPRYGWKVEFFLDFDCDHIGEVMRALQDVDCEFETLERAYMSMRRCNEDTGLTYSTKDYRTSVAVAYTASSASEMLNTVAHECAHICAHITQSFIIKLTEEEFCEMVGDLVGGLSDSILKVLEYYKR